ncbi:MAG: cysteine dioxygenase family protein [Ekhidna sp.]
METIKTIDELVQKLSLMKKDHSKVLDIMSLVEIPREDFERYFRWSDARYTRNVLARTEDFEVLLVCWEKGQISPIHDFNSQEAWIHPVVGKLREERFKINIEDERLERVSNMILGDEEFSYMKQVAIHRYSNAYEGRSVSLNIYCRPVTEWRVYDEHTTDCAVLKPWITKDFHITVSS